MWNRIRCLHIPDLSDREMVTTWFSKAFEEIVKVIDMVKSERTKVCNRCLTEILRELISTTSGNNIDRRILS